MFYYLYQITNLVNNKIYVGVHKTSDLSDGYMGSGKVIKDAIRKYGIDNFKKDILETFENAEAMYAREKEIVTDEFLLREDVYNLRRGGTGGFDYINSNLTDEIRQMRSLNAKSIPHELRVLAGKKTGSANLIKAHAAGKLRHDTFTGKTHTEETKQKMSKKAKERLSNPENNSQYGTMWITNGIENKKIKKDDTIPEGWNRGRNIK